MCCNNSLLEKLSTFPVTNDRILLEDCVWFPSDLIPRVFPFFFFVFALYFFTVRDLYYMLSLVSPSSESPTGGVVYGISNTTIEWQIETLRNYRLMYPEWSLNANLTIVLQLSWKPQRQPIHKHCLKKNTYLHGKLYITNFFSLNSTIEDEIQ